MLNNRVIHPNDLPELYSQDGKYGETVAYLKFYAPGTDAGWYATEYDKENLFFGLVHLFESELGVFSRDEIVNSNLIVCDHSFQPTMLKDLDICPEWLKKAPAEILPMDDVVRHEVVESNGLLPLGDEC